MRNLLGICIVIVFLVTFVTVLVASYFFLRAAFNRSPDGPRHWLVKINRFNAVLFPGELSPVGRRYRALWLKTLIISLCSGALLVGLAIGLAMTKSN
jgi:hypothetical protein